MEVGVEFGAFLGVDFCEAEGGEGFFEGFGEGSEFFVNLDGAVEVVEKGEEFGDGAFAGEFFGGFAVFFDVFTEVFEVGTGALEVSDELGDLGVFMVRGGGLRLSGI